MMKIILLVLVAICLAAAAKHEFVGTADEKFEQFKTVFRKEYKSPIEEQMRRSVFRANLIEAERMTKESKGKTTYGVTQFSDLTKEEFKHIYLMPNPPALKKMEGHDLEINETGDETKSWDWRYVKSAKTTDGWSGCVTPVYNQGQCGSCWAFSATEQIESMTCLQGYESLVSLSMQQIVDCTTSCYGCNGGWTYSAFEEIISETGIDTYASYPYTCSQGSCQFNKANIGASIKSWSYVGQGSEPTMLSYIQQTGPLSICVDASTWSSYTGGVITCSSCGQQLDHCVQLTGYDANVSGTKAWIVRNSWGTSWGYSGYLYVQYGCNACGINCVPTTVQGESPQ
jgi:C1A family cysteine protease